MLTNICSEFNNLLDKTSACSHCYMRMTPVEAIENNYICHNGLNVFKNNSIAHENDKMSSFSTAGSSCQDNNVDYILLKYYIT